MEIEEYKNKIYEFVKKIDNIWILNQIYRFVTNIIK